MGVRTEAPGTASPTTPISPIHVTRPDASGGVGGLPATGGTYVLLLRVGGHAILQVGRCGRLELQPGWYLYVGSAFGPGGVRARVGRHARRDKRPRWHIDYLREHAELIEVWHAAGHNECAWAVRLGGLPGAVAPLAGFGASDCTCPSHLWYLAAPPDQAVLQAPSASGPAIPADGQTRLRPSALAR